MSYLPLSHTRHLHYFPLWKEKATTNFLQLSSFTQWISSLSNLTQTHIFYKEKKQLNFFISQTRRTKQKYKVHKSITNNKKLLCSAKRVADMWKERMEVGFTQLSGCEVKGDEVVVGTWRCNKGIVGGLVCAILSEQVSFVSTSSYFESDPFFWYCCCVLNFYLIMKVYRFWWRVYECDGKGCCCCSVEGFVVVVV